MAFRIGQKFLNNERLAQRFNVHNPWIRSPHVSISSINNCKKFDPDKHIYSDLIGMYGQLQNKFIKLEK